VTGLETVVRERSDPAGVAWLDESVAAVAADPTAVRSRFAAAGRKVGRGPLHPDDEPGDLFTWTVDDAARVVLLAAMGRAAADEIPALYRHGDAGLPLVEDALRTNDLRLVAAAMGPYALGRLDDAALAQAVLKCVFMGIPVGRIDGLDRRATPDMARMLAGFVHERIAAGRDIPGDVWPLIDRHPPPESIAAIEAEVDSTVPERRNAALAALALRPTPSP
jgi:hypothetical protein